MSGKRISKAERRIVSANRSFVKKVRESEFSEFGNNVESSKYLRSVVRMGK